MRYFGHFSCAAIALLATPTLTHAEAVKIGIITTVSGPNGYLGEDVRDGFLLVTKRNGGKLGKTPVEFLIEDDAFDPGRSKQIAERMLKQNQVKLFTGTVFSNVLLAEAPTILNGGGFLVSPNAGPSQLAGKGCHKNLFVASWQNDSAHEAAGEFATQQGYKRVLAFVPNYAAGRDSIAGFKRFYKGTLLAEVYTKLDQTDYSAEMAQIRELKPDAIYQGHPGGLGINFNKQFAQAGLNKTVQMLVPFASMEQRLMEAVGDDAIGVRAFGSWSADLDIPENKQFVADFKAEYGRIPTDYAAQAFDTANLIGAALDAVGGDLSRADEFRAAMEKADFKSVRGNFKFNTNHFPILDFYGRVVQKAGDGTLEMKTTGKVFTNHGDAYVSECKM